MTQHRIRIRRLVLRLGQIAVVTALAFVSSFASGNIVIDWPELIVFTDDVSPVNGVAHIVIDLNDVSFPDATSPPTLTSYNLQFKVTSGTGLTFDAPVNAASTPLFPNLNFNAFGSYPSTTVTAANDGPAVTAMSGKGILDAPFTVAGGHLFETYPISITIAQVALDGSPNSHLVTFGGSISVHPVPEPAAVIGMSAVALVSAAAAFVVRRRKLA